MPKYAFCVEEAGSESAYEWSELLDIEEAKCVAARVARDHLNQGSDELWNRPEWRVVVKDSDGFQILAVRVSATMTQAG